MRLWGRREFIRIGAVTPLGLDLGGYFRLRESGAAGRTEKADRSCIFILLDGGPAHLDTWDMKPEAPAGVRGPFKPIPTNVAGIQICEHLPRSARQADKYAILRSVTGRTANHGDAVQFLLTARPPSRPAGFASPGLATAMEPGPYRRMPSHSLGASHAKRRGIPGSLHEARRARPDPDPNHIRVDGLELPTDTNWREISDRKWLVQQIDACFGERDAKGVFEAGGWCCEQAESIPRSPRVKKAFDIWSEPESLRVRYGVTPLGQGCLLARRLAEAGARFVTVNAARAIWDTHADSFRLLEQQLLPEFDMAFSALMEDMHQRGLLENTLVVAAGEFGRTPKINAQAGRDHWPRVFSVVLAGAGVRGGQVYGSSDACGAEPKDRPVAVEDLAATIYDRLGIFPAREPDIADRRALKIGNNGTPIRSPLV